MVAERKAGGGCYDDDERRGVSSDVVSLPSWRWMITVKTVLKFKRRIIMLRRAPVLHVAQWSRGVIFRNNGEETNDGKL